jgi:hypothetical protein
VRARSGFPELDVRPLQHLAGQLATPQAYRTPLSEFTSAGTFSSSYYVICKLPLTLLYTSQGESLTSLHRGVPQYFYRRREEVF